MTAAGVPDYIRHSNLFGTLQEDDVREILALCRSVRVRSGEVVCAQGEQGESMFIIERGRVSIDVDDGLGTRRLINYLGPGDHFGEMSLLVGSPRSASVTAMMDSNLLELVRDDFDRTLNRIPRFAANLSRSLGIWLRGQISGRQRPERTLVALVRGCDEAAGLAAQLGNWVREQGGQLQVISDQPSAGRCAAWHAVPANDDCEDRMLERLATAVAANQRILVDVAQCRATPRLLMQQELVWWVIDRPLGDMDERLAQFSKVVEATPLLAQRVQIIRTLPATESLPPANTAAFNSTHRTLRIQHAGSGARAVCHPRDVSRLGRLMRGIQLGLALGGGGARGIAHLGVLEVCEREGIYFDRVAGTSAGAMIATAYAAGIPLDQIMEVFAKEMTPSAALGWLPKAPQWYLLATFRLGLLEAKFRRYLGDSTFEQLLLPAQTVSVDLVSGEHRIRSAGDVVNAVLESINHPVFGKPILRHGEALVDGGVLMNLPVTALRQQGVDFSVAVDIGKQLSPEFAACSSDSPNAKLKAPGYISTLLRVADVQQKSLAALHGAQCGFLIAPNTGSFAFDDFTQGAGLVEVGRRAAEEALPRLKQVLADKFAWHRPRAEVSSDPLHLRDAA